MKHPKSFKLNEQSYKVVSEEIMKAAKAEIERRAETADIDLGILDIAPELDERYPGHSDVRMLALTLVGSLGAGGWTTSYDAQVRFLIKQLREVIETLEGEVT